MKLVPIAMITAALIAGCGGTGSTAAEDPAPESSRANAIGIANESIEANGAEWLREICDSARTLGRSDALAGFATGFTRGDEAYPEHVLDELLDDCPPTDPTPAGGAEPVDPPDAPSGQVDVDGSKVPEELLASIDEESSVVETRRVRRLAHLLDRIEPACGGKRSRIADYAVNSQQILDEENGIEVSTQDILEEVAEAAEAGSTGCQDLFLLYVATAAP